MRRRRHLAAGLLLIAACTSTTTATTDQFQSTAPTFPSDEMPTSTATTVPPTTTTTAPLASTSAETTRGVLPDGTVFDVYIEPWSEEEVTEIYAPIMVDLDDGTGMLETTFSEDVAASSQWDGTIYQLPAGPLTVAIEVSEFLIDIFGSGYRSIVEAGITATSVSGWPVLLLTPPFRWPAMNDPVEMEVDYETFSVMPFCDELAVACSTTHSVQVSQFAGYESERAWRIESPLSRTASDPHFLDPGPLGPRAVHDLIWTGEEMIVWGGASGDRSPHLVEGAAFDPETNVWRMLPPSPISNEQETRAIWAGDEMVVMSQGALAGYSPVSSTWSVIGGGFPPALIPGTTVASDTFVYTWTPSGIVEVDVETGVWRELPDPGFGGDDAHEGALRILDGSVHAIGLEDGPCTGRILSLWTGSVWESLPKPPLATAEYADCSQPSQTAVADGRLILWEDDENPTVAYDPDLGTWQEIARIPLSGVEGAPSPVPMDDGFLVPGSGEAAIYHPSTDQWEPVGLENPNSSLEMLWTGDELLMWGAACCNDDAGRFRFQDALRWTPPD